MMNTGGDGECVQSLVLQLNIYINAAADQQANVL